MKTGSTGNAGLPPVKEVWRTPPRRRREPVDAGVRQFRSVRRRGRNARGRAGRRRRISVTTTSMSKRGRLKESKHSAGRTGAPCSAIKAVDSDAAKGHVAQRRAGGFDHVRKLRAFRLAAGDQRQSVGAQDWRQLVEADSAWHFSNLVGKLRAVVRRRPAKLPRFGCSG